MGEGEVSRRQADAPKSSESPYQALLPNPHFQPTLIDKYGYTTLGAFAGLGAVITYNWLNKLPSFSGLQRLPFAIAFGAVATTAYQRYRESQYAERDAIFRHYISLHPEDFPAYNRVKFGNKFDDWLPIR